MKNVLIFAGGVVVGFIFSKLIGNLLLVGLAIVIIGGVVMYVKKR